MESNKSKKKFMFFRKAGLFLATFISLTYVLAVLSQIGGWLIARTQYGAKAVGPLSMYESPGIKIIKNAIVDDSGAFVVNPTR